MTMAYLENQGLIGEVSYYANQFAISYILRVWRRSDILDNIGNSSFIDPIYVMSFSDGVRAEDRLLELLEHPAWTLLKYGK